MKVTGLARLYAPGPVDRRVGRARCSFEFFPLHCLDKPNDCVPVHSFGGHQNGLPSIGRNRNDSFASEEICNDKNDRHKEQTHCRAVTLSEGADDGYSRKDE